MLNSHIRQYICKNTKNIQKSDFMDGFCLLGELDLTLFYKIEGYFDNLKSLMTLMTVTLMTGPFWGDWKMIMTLNDFDPSWPEFSVERKWPLSSYWGERSFWFLSHAARYSERSSDSGQNADGYLKNCFPSVRFHLFWMLNVECWMLNFLWADRLG